MPNSGTKPRQFGHLQQIGIQTKEIKIKGFGDLPKLASVNIMLVENLADGARVARQLLRQPDVAAPLPFQFGPYCFAYVRKFVHSVALCRASPSKSNHKESVETFCITFHSGFLDYHDREASTKSPRYSVNFCNLFFSINESVQFSVKRTRA